MHRADVRTISRAGRWADLAAGRAVYAGHVRRGRRLVRPEAVPRTPGSRPPRPRRRWASPSSSCGTAPTTAARGACTPPAPRRPRHVHGRERRQLPAEPHQRVDPGQPRSRRGHHEHRLEASRRQLHPRAVALPARREHALQLRRDVTAAQRGRPRVQHGQRAQRLLAQRADRPGARGRPAGRGAGPGPPGVPHRLRQDRPPALGAGEGRRGGRLGPARCPRAWPRVSRCTWSTRTRWRR